MFIVKSNDKHIFSQYLDLGHLISTTFNKKLEASLLQLESVVKMLEELDVSRLGEQFVITVIYFFGYINRNI